MALSSVRGERCFSCFLFLFPSLFFSLFFGFLFFVTLCWHGSRGVDGIVIGVGVDCVYLHVHVRQARSITTEVATPPPDAIHMLRYALCMHCVREKLRTDGWIDGIIQFSFSPVQSSPVYQREPNKRRRNEEEYD